MRPVLPSPKTSIEERMQEALTNLADIVGRPEMTDNDPLSSMSFSCLSEEGIQRQTSILGKYVLEKEPTFSPLGPDGRPLRRYESACSSAYSFVNIFSLGIPNTEVNIGLKIRGKIRLRLWVRCSDRCYFYSGLTEFTRCHCLHPRSRQVGSNEGENTWAVGSLGDYRVAS